MNLYKIPLVRFKPLRYFIQSTRTTFVVSAQKTTFSLAPILKFKMLQDDRPVLAVHLREDCYFCWAGIQNSFINLYQEKFLFRMWTSTNRYNSNMKTMNCLVIHNKLYWEKMNKLIIIYIYSFGSQSWFMCLEADSIRIWGSNSSNNLCKTLLFGLSFTYEDRGDWNLSRRASLRSKSRNVSMFSMDLVSSKKNWTTK